MRCLLCRHAAHAPSPPARPFRVWPETGSAKDSMWSFVLIWCRAIPILWHLSHFFFLMQKIANNRLVGRVSVCPLVLLCKSKIRLIHDTSTLHNQTNWFYYQHYRSNRLALIVRQNRRQSLQTEPLDTGWNSPLCQALIWLNLLQDNKYYSSFFAFDVEGFFFFHINLSYRKQIDALT